MNSCEICGGTEPEHFLITESKYLDGTETMTICLDCHNDETV